jgi:hypothetical protein
LQKLLFGFVQRSRGLPPQLVPDFWVLAQELWQRTSQLLNQLCVSHTSRPRFRTFGRSSEPTSAPCMLHYCLFVRQGDNTRYPAGAQAADLLLGTWKEAFSIAVGDLLGDLTRELSEPIADGLHTTRQRLPARCHPRIGADHEAVWVT